ncbi:MAG: HRDC domain-containing protein, partial [Planctomycetes bacterium]|nr:HRDC domain-containing protein [Planctomycetota bacterium]
MKYDDITTDRQLADLCRELRGAASIEFDTEFVSERTYRPQLCLVQVAWADRLAVIDTLAVGDVAPFWTVITEGDHETVVHAGREELAFSLASVGRRPKRLFDVQIAAGMVGYDYPAGWGSLNAKILGEKINKGETRTNWHHRPLSQHQIEYALSDVVNLKLIRDKLHEGLQQLDRVAWFEDEMRAWQDSVEQSLSRNRWRRVSRISGLSPRSLAVVRELWHWRDKEAERRNCPVKRVLRDDLIVELAKRRTSDPKRIMAVRGLDRGDLRRAAGALAKCVSRAMELPEDELPHGAPREGATPETLLVQFLFSALGSICRSAQIA